MPAGRAAARATPLGKQRVRTGCLTCRKRRRKCDERKPRCENCEAKGFSCEYRIDLAFVQSSSSAALGSDDSSSRTVQTYSSIKFIINDVAAASAPGENESETYTPLPEPRDESSLTGHFPVGSRFSNGAAIRQESSSHSNFRSLRHPIGIPSYHAGENEMTPLDPLGAPGHSSTSVLGNKAPAHHIKVTTNLSPSNSFADGPESAIIHHETSLLRYYRYNVAPWIDVGDPESSFGIKVMLEAKEHRALLDAILALSSYHRSLTSAQSGGDLESARRFGQEAENGLRIAKDNISRIANTLFMLRDIFSSSPRRWRDVLSRHLRSSSLFSAPASLNDHSDEALFWVYFKIDLATAVSASQSPIIPFLSFLQNNGSLVSQYRSLSQLKSPKQTFQHILLLLASCLSFTFGVDEPSYSHTVPQKGSMLRSIPNLTSSGWTSLWTDCLGWYNDRPVELQQIVDIRGEEVDQIDIKRTSSFPILTYTTPLALVANAVYHIASLLLLTHKPRLLRAVTGPRCFLSPMWHAQSIAGIATADDSPEQWDPILVAGLILVAKDMTYEAQQSAVLERLRMINATTGMNLVEEIAELRRCWSIAGYNDEMTP